MDTENEEHQFGLPMSEERRERLIREYEEELEREKTLNIVLKSWWIPEDWSSWTQNEDLSDAERKEKLFKHLEDDYACTGYDLKLSDIDYLNYFEESLVTKKMLLSNYKEHWGLPELYRLVKEWIKEKRLELKEQLDLKMILDNSVVTNQFEDQPISLVKLPWNASNSSLYHLFAQLLEIRTKRGKLLFDNTPDSVATFLLQSFSIPGKATQDTITRAIQTYMKGEKDSSNGKPPKDALTLNGIDFEPD